MLGSKQSRRTPDLYGERSRSVRSCLTADRRLCDAKEFRAYNFSLEIEGGVFV